VVYLAKGRWWSRDGADGGDCAAFPSANQGGASMDSIADEIRQIIAKALKIPIEQLTPQSRLQDLGVESLDMIEIIFALEEKFDINIPYNANEAAATDKRESSIFGAGKLETIDQISTAVKGLIDAKTSV
jgi:acyl carrier protein